MTPATPLAPLTRPSLSTVAELLKPITWFPPMWAFGCGVASSAVPLEGKWPLIIAGVTLAGPLVCASSQAANDWFDRHVDAINEPKRPIPSGRMPGQWGLAVAVLWTALSLLVATTLGTWGFRAGVVGLLLAWAYSAPPFRLKANGWWGNLACGLSYEGLAWVTGAAVMLDGAMPNGRILALALLYSLGAHGIMTLNDFKAIEGDQKMGIQSLPVQLGAEGAALVACTFMLAPQVLVIAFLWQWGATWHPWAVLGLVVAQALLMFRFVQKPVERAIWYSALGINFFVAGMLISAFGVRGLPGP
jgi:chlorophyll/bacteriochlorophyll a synthase